ncbi:hypothetical protein TNCV_2850141 [Trichonephila clavipes]|nr:hypothetical protein TNCV_2850141 [Trichonephila clavipes]
MGAEELDCYRSAVSTIEEAWQKLEATSNNLTTSVIQASKFKSIPKRVILTPKGLSLLGKYGIDNFKLILFNDEAHFWSNGYVNKQNCRIWSEANPQVYVETPLHPEKLTDGALYGLVESFFKNDEGHNVTVNGDRFRAMITNFSFLN